MNADGIRGSDSETDAFILMLKADRRRERKKHCAHEKSPQWDGDMAHHCGDRAAV